MSRNIWIGALMVIMIAGGAWWYFTQSSAPTTSVTTQMPAEQTTQQTTQPSSALSTSAPVGWSTYENSNYGYSVMHPSNATYTVDNSGKSSSGSVDFSLSNTANLSADLVIYPPFPLSDTNAKKCMTAPQTAQDESLTNLGTVNINGVSFFTYTEPTFAISSTVSATNKSYEVSHNGDCYSMQEEIRSAPGVNTAQTSAELDTIAQTFRFTN